MHSREPFTRVARERKREITAAIERDDNSALEEDERMMTIMKMMRSGEVKGKGGGRYIRSAARGASAFTHVFPCPLPLSSLYLSLFISLSLLVSLRKATGIREEDNSREASRDRTTARRESARIFEFLSFRSGETREVL